LNGVMSFFKVTGGLVSLFLETLYWCKSALRNTDKITDQLLVIGYQTLPVGTLIALFTGGVLALQAGPTLARKGARPCNGFDSYSGQGRVGDGGRARVDERI
jgi:phospholipid/cholesterol/gamma-HCH transport system permease protein